MFLQVTGWLSKTEKLHSITGEPGSREKNFWTSTSQAWPLVLQTQNIDLAYAWIRSWLDTRDWQNIAIWHLQKTIQRLHPNMGFHTSQKLRVNKDHSFRREFVFQGSIFQTFLLARTNCRGMVSLLTIVQLWVVDGDRTDEPCTCVVQFVQWQTANLASNQENTAGHGQACMPVGAEPLQPPSSIALCRSRCWRVIWSSFELPFRSTPTSGPDNTGHFSETLLKPYKLSSLHF